jgi:hypothetical protein
VDDVVKSLLEANLELTRLNADLARELAGLRTRPLQLPDSPYERLYLTEEEEDEQFLKDHDPYDGVDMSEVREVLALTGLDPNIEVH